MYFFLCYNAAGKADYCASRRQLHENDLHNSIDRKVSFSDLHILEFLPVLGDNPSCRCGPPITIASEPINETLVDLEEYESSKFANGMDNRRSQDLFLTSFNRRFVLTEEGKYSLADIRKAQKQVQAIRGERRMSIEKQKIEILLLKGLKRMRGILFIVKCKDSRW
uniref:Uncharacterized protein n=1 Tax=Corethron hystrix TaxID=216773 RepID=A0A7S1BW44_9STRA|mmetsp:Transcript_41042/g.96355  ORF Transcript_41042/g.96355 Transcript_41042/m.96355 type:complete len:166 (+) Transcript_41042:440-937(+)